LAIVRADGQMLANPKYLFLSRNTIAPIHDGAERVESQRLDVGHRLPHRAFRPDAVWRAMTSVPIDPFSGSARRFCRYSSTVLH
jgi:hypothetical protein